MAVSNNLKRILTETIASNINEIVFGFDGTPATSSDGSIRRPAVTVTPTVTVIDTGTLLIEATLPTSESFNDSIKEVHLRLRGSSGFTPISRHSIRPIVKDSSNEIKVQIIMEVK